MSTREDIINHYAEHPDVSVLIIGAGINGIGTFRDLALQGVDVLIVDKGDFCSGSSAASSRQAHGGLRYLEHGDFRLVRESLLERNRLLRNAPHAVELLPTTIPIYHWLSGLLNAPFKFLGLLKKPNERGYLVIKLGMMMYDWFTRNDRMTPTHKMLDRQTALRKHPALNPAIIGAATYYDCLMPQAERIALELVLDGEATLPDARALNYTSVISGGGDSVTLRDEMSGKQFTVKPKIVVNAAGAWIDFVNRDLKKTTQFIGGTKGSHIVVEHPELAKTLDGSVIYFENTDGRLGIFMPLRDKVVIGATDIRIDDPDQAVCTDEEIDYFLAFTKHVLPNVTVDRSQIVFHFSGVRPLPKSDTEFVGLITREHQIRTVEPDADVRFPIFSLVGGKWTTYRAFSEQTTDAVLNRLGRQRAHSTQDLAIGGGKQYPHSAAEREAWMKRVQTNTGLPSERIKTLFERYGTRAEDIAAYLLQAADAPIAGSSYSRREIMFIAEHEKVIHLDDIIIRRSMIGLLGIVTGEFLAEAAAAAGAILGWTSEQQQQEIEHSATILTRWHGVPAQRLQLPKATAHQA
ncbi:MAG: glycerol-3-phosphate dehydrogenase/oxidase [Anaerolineae bacterium]|nr:glycerol-3-phosphate dehydrogenase/oxidase [Anaerolineae bacterium]